MTTKSDQTSSKIVATFRNKIKSAHRVVHVIPTKHGWSVKRGRSTRAYRAGRTFDEAVRIAKDFKSADEVVIHYKNGKYKKIMLDN